MTPVTFTGRDLAKIGLPLQIAGAAVLVIGIVFVDIHWTRPNSLLIPGGALAHFLGDTFFFFQMKKQGCL